MEPALQEDIVVNGFQRDTPDTLETVYFKGKNVDLSNRLINEVILCQTGEAEGHGMHVEESFLIDLVKYVNSNDGGCRCNFGHNWDNMGLQLGRFFNVRLSGNKVIGELNVFNAADDSPKLPKMGTYILNLANEDSKSVMCSIVFKAKYYYQYDENGKEVKMKGWDWWEGIFSNQDTKKKLYPKFEKLYSTDLVSDGALTTSLFSKNFQKFNKKMAETTEKDQAEKPDLATELAELKTLVEQYKLEIQSLKAAQKDAGDEATTNLDEQKSTQEKTEYSALQKELEELKTLVTELRSKIPGDKHTNSKAGETDAIDKKEVYSAVTQRAIDRFGK